MHPSAHQLLWQDLHSLPQLLFTWTMTPHADPLLSFRRPACFLPTEASINPPAGTFGASLKKKNYVQVFLLRVTRTWPSPGKGYPHFWCSCQACLSLHLKEHICAVFSLYHGFHLLRSNKTGDQKPKPPNLPSQQSRPSIKEGSSRERSKIYPIPEIITQPRSRTNKRHVCRGS